MTSRKAIEVLGKERAAEIVILALEDGVPHEAIPRLKLAALLELATRSLTPPA